MARIAALRDLQPRRVALIKPSALGDIVHSLPVLTALRHRFPEAHLAWVVNRAYEPILRGHPHLDEIVAFDRGLAKRNWARGLLDFARLLRELRRRDFDLVIDLQGLLRTGLMTLATRAPRRIGLRTAREGSRWSYTDVIDDRPIAHAVDRYWAVAEALGCEGPKDAHVPIDPEARAWALRQLGKLPRPWLAVGVGSRWLTKRWPPAHFARLTQLALDHAGGAAIFIGTPDEAALADEAVRQTRGPALNLAGRTTLPQLAALLSLADLMLANDTGPLHLAAALGRPVLAPYTCTKAARTGPYGPRAFAVESNVWCQGSYLKLCARLECMAELTPERLWPTLRQLLDVASDAGRPATSAKRQA